MTVQWHCYNNGKKNKRGQIRKVSLEKYMRLRGKTEGTEIAVGGFTGWCSHDE